MSSVSFKNLRVCVGLIYPMLVGMSVFVPLFMIADYLFNAEDSLTIPQGFLVGIEAYWSIFWLLSYKHWRKTLVTMSNSDNEDVNRTVISLANNSAEEITNFDALCAMWSIFWRQHVISLLATFIVHIVVAYIYLESGPFVVNEANVHYFNLCFVFSFLPGLYWAVVTR